MKPFFSAVASQAGLILIGVVALIALSRLGALNDAHDQAITNASQAQLALHPALVKWRQKLHEAETQVSQVAAASHHTANELRHELDSARSHPDTVKLLKLIAVADSTAYAKCSLAFQTCERRAESAEAEADSLNKRLAAQVTIKPKRWGLTVGGGACVVPSGFGWCAAAIVGYRIFP